MPDKEGSDDEKSTKSVVNKKQKQMMGEEGYDIARDMGRVRPSKDKKDATTMPPSKEMEKTRKVNKGPSALEVVKKKYKGQIMKMEELDLTQVAEAFGGYIIEISDEMRQRAAMKALKKRDEARKSGDSAEFAKRQRQVQKFVNAAVGDYKYKQQGIEDLQRMSRKSQSAFAGEPKDQSALRQVIGTARRARPDLFGNPDATPTNRGRKIDKKQTTSDAPAVDFDRAAKNLSAFTRRVRGDISADDLDAEIRAGRRQEARRKKEVQQIIDPNRRFFTDKPDSETLKTQPTGDESQFLDKEGKPAQKRGKPATRRKSTATPPAFATRKGESGGPLPVSMRNVRVPKTSSLSPNVKVTSIVKPKVGALARTDQETSAITKGQIDYKALQDRVRTVTPDQVISPKGDPLKVNQPKEGPTIDIAPETETQTQTGRRTRTCTPTKIDIKKLKPPKIDGYIEPEIKKPEKTDEPIADPIGGGTGGGKKTKVGNFSYRPGGAFSRIRGFARRNPVLSLVGYDALKNLKVPSVTKPTKTGKVSAGQ